MKTLWSLCNNRNWKKNTKNKLFTCLWTLTIAMIGAVLWITIGRASFSCSAANAFVCFIGYPSMILGFIGSILYLCNHDFN